MNLADGMRKVSVANGGIQASIVYGLRWAVQAVGYVIVFPLTWNSVFSHHSGGQNSRIVSSSPAWAT